MFAKCTYTRAVWQSIAQWSNLQLPPQNVASMRRLWHAVRRCGELWWTHAGDRIHNLEYMEREVSPSFSKQSAHYRSTDPDHTAWHFRLQRSELGVTP
jgi:hypothetical protein